MGKKLTDQETIDYIKGKSPKPDYDFWTKLDLWWIEDAIDLFCYCEPGWRAEDISDKRKSVYEIIDNAATIGNFPLSDSRSDGHWVEPAKFISWAKDKGLSIPDELKVLLKSEKNPVEENLRPDQQDKREVQAIAERTWKKHEVLDIKHMKKLPAIKKIVRRLYKQKTLHNWLSEVAPDRAKKAGRRDPTTRARQDAACQKLGIIL
jgi:hypothetical protein